MKDQQNFGNLYSDSSKSCSQKSMDKTQNSRNAASDEKTTSKKDDSASAANKASNKDCHRDYND